MKTKTFDCVQAKDEWGAALDEKLKGLSFEEEQEFWKKSSEKLRALMVEMKKKGLHEGQKAGI